MSAVIPAIVLVVGMGALATGIRAWRSTKRLALLGAGQIALAAAFLIPESRAGWRYGCYALATIFCLAIAVTIKREVWRQVRLEFLLFGATAFAIIATELLSNIIPRDMELVLLGVVAVLAAELIVALLVRAAGFLRTSAQAN